MQKPIKVCDSKFILIISIICLIFFLPSFILAAFSDIVNQDMSMIAVFGGSALLGLWLLIDFLRRKLLLYEDHISYTPTFGRTRAFSYSEIRSVVPTGEKYTIYGYNGEKLAAFETNMPAASTAINYLAMKQVKIEPPKFLSLPVKISNWLSNLGTPYRDTCTTFIFPVSTVKKQKRQLRAVRLLLLLLSILAIFLPRKWIPAISILILLLIYLPHLIYYPKMSWKRYSDESYVPFPALSCIISLFILYTSLITMHMEIEKGKWIIVFIILALVLSAPYPLLLHIQKIKVPATEFILTVCIFFLLSLCFAPSIYYLASTIF